MIPNTLTPVRTIESRESDTFDFCPIHFSLPTSILAIEVMSPEEIAIRTEHDSVMKKLVEYVQPHKVDSNEMVEYFCPDELNEMKLSRDKFNKFMLDKIATPAYKTNRTEKQ